MKLKFKKAVDAGDLVIARLFLANEMMLDPRGSSFNEMRSYAEASFSNLYDAHDGGSFEMNKDCWNKDLLYSVRNDLDANFSRERLDFYCNVAKYVLKEKAESLNEEERQSSQSKSNTSDNPKEETYTSNSKKKVYSSVTIGGAAFAFAGLFIEKTAVACAVTSMGVIGMAVGVYLIYNESKK